MTATSTKQRFEFRDIRPGRVLTWTLLFLGGIVMVIPILYMLLTSIKYPHEVYALRLIPREPTLENYWFVLKDGRFFPLVLEFVLHRHHRHNVERNIRQPGRLHAGEVQVPRSRRGVCRHPLDADDPDGNAGDPLVHDFSHVRLARYHLGHHVSWHDDRVRHVPDEAILRDRARRFHRRGAHRRAQRVADLVVDRDAAGHTSPVGAGDLRLSRQLDGFHLAADRHHQPRQVHAAGGAHDVQRREHRSTGS